MPCPQLLYPWERALLPIVQGAHFRYIYKVTAGMSVSACLYVSLWSSAPPTRQICVEIDSAFLFLELLNTFKFLLKSNKMKYFT